MYRYLSAAFFAFASASVLAGCSLPGVTGPAPGAGAQAGARPAKSAQEIVVPFSLSKSLGTFDATTGKRLTLISGKKTRLSGPLGATTDAEGNVYVSGSGTALGVYEYAAGASGNAAPIAFDKGLTADGLAGDGAHVYIADQYTGEISEYAADPLGSTPIATLSGKKTTLCAAIGIAVDSKGDLFVTQQGFGTNCTNDVLEFAPLAPGAQNVAPIRTIAGSKTLVNEPEGIAVDANGNVYVADEDDGMVLEFGGSQNGNAKPAATFGAGDYGYAGVAVDSSNVLYAAAPNATDVNGQIDLFDATKPSAKPTKTYKIGAKKGQRDPLLIAL
ncbi:MAG TPA: hypothetical protein VMU38_08265 [Candidatus Binatia bacterium]|nr:hypothetical protein [Candidatus Binatia bacterium]